MRKLGLLVVALVAAVGCGKSESVGKTGGTTGTTAGTGAGATSGGSSASASASSASSSGSTTGAASTASSSSSGSGSGSSGSSSGSTSGSPLTLTALRERVLVEDGGPVVEEAVDLSHNGLVALIPDDVHGTYQSISGQVTCASGTCQTPDVPVGDYFLVLDRELVETTSRTVDLTFARLGRAAPAVATQPTPVSFNLTNLVPAQDADRVELSDLNANFLSRRLLTDVRGPLDAGTFAPGETTLDGTVDWQGRQLVEPSLGDPLFVSQMSYADGGANGRSFTRTQVRYLDLSGVAIQDGAPATVTGALQDVAGGNFSQLQLQFQVAVSAAFTSEVPPGFIFDRVSLFEGALPHYGKYGAFNPNVVEHNYVQVGDASQLPLNVSGPLYLTYPPYWNPLVRASGNWYKPLAVSAQPGGTFYASSGFFTSAPVIIIGSDVGPGLGLPLNLKVNGQPTTAPLTGVTSTPTITWDPPSTGTPLYYSGAILDIAYSATNQRVDVVRALSFLVPATRHRFVVPPDFALQSGHSYVVDLRAIDTGTDSSTFLPKVQMTEHPFQALAQEYSTHVESDLLTP